MTDRKLFAASARIWRQDLCESAQRAQTAQLLGRLNHKHISRYMRCLQQWNMIEQTAAKRGWDDPLYQPIPPIDSRVGRK